MKKNNFSRYLLFISVATLLTILTLIVQKSYDNLMKASIEAKSSGISRPINPDLNLEVLDKIESRSEFNPTNP